jgi:hypothetical protein
MGFPRVAIAKENMVTFKLHKIISVQNNQTKGINNISFSVYDTTGTFYTLRQQGYTVEEAQRAISKMTSSKEAIKKGSTETIAGEAGIWQVSLPAVERLESADFRYKVYLFLETKSSNEIYYKATPLVVVLPLSEENQTTDTAVDLYPKEVSSDVIINNTETSVRQVTKGKQQLPDMGERMAHKACFLGVAIIFFIVFYVFYRCKYNKTEFKENEIEKRTH